VTPPLFLLEPEQVRAVAVGSVIEVAGDEGHHAVDVKRLRPDEPVWLGDGAGRIAEARVVDAVRGRLVATVTALRDVESRADRYVVIQAPARGGRDEDAVEAMTEAGVDEVVGWSAGRAVAKWTDRTASRWQATARAATKQSRRAWLPRISGPASTAEVAARLQCAACAFVLEPGADVALATVAAAGLPVGEIAIVVGPEGGITAQELETLAAAGVRAVRLGTEVLRASTAGVVALAVLSAVDRWR
jgi:16S rRNA (uracil1498-N3)-methyltransferase